MIINMNEYTQSEYITVKEACAVSNIKKTTLLKMIREHRLPNVKIRKITNKILINKTDFNKFLESRTIQL